MLWQVRYVIYKKGLQGSFDIKNPQELGKECGSGGGWDLFGGGLWRKVRWAWVKCCQCTQRFPRSHSTYPMPPMRASRVSQIEASNPGLPRRRLHQARLCVCSCAGGLKSPEYMKLNPQVWAGPGMWGWDTGTLQSDKMAATPISSTSSAQALGPAPC